MITRVDVSPVGVEERICDVDGCGRRHHAHGLCGKHALQKWRQTATPKSSPCSADDCSNVEYSRGLCRKHYRLDLYRDAEMVIDLETPRFWDRVDVGLCWEWSGARSGLGYGCFWFGTRMIRAHVWAWLALVGPIAEGLDLDHLCRNTRCVNPDHLEPVTRAENARRGHAALTW